MSAAVIVAGSKAYAEIHINTCLHMHGGLGVMSAHVL